MGSGSSIEIFAEGEVESALRKSDPIPNSAANSSWEIFKAGYDYFDLQNTSKLTNLNTSATIVLSTQSFARRGNLSDINENCTHGLLLNAFSHEYCLEDLGPIQFEWKGEKMRRFDFTVLNNKHQQLQCRCVYFISLLFCPNAVYLHFLVSKLAYGIERVHRVQYVLLNYLHFCR